MAKSEKKVRSSSSLLVCFGFPRKKQPEKPMFAAEDGGEKKKKISRWLLCSKFRLKNREIKPAPIEETETLTSIVEDGIVKDKPTDHKNIPADDDKSVNQEIKETKLKNLRDITTDRSKPIESLASFKEDTSQEKISTSTSTRYVKPNPKPKPSRTKNGSRVEKFDFDPLIGISIILVTLMIMLIWGRLCAILCTAAWCYFLPRIRDAAVLSKRKRSGSEGIAFVPDLNSMSYKRKVVLDGFLERQNRVSL